MFSILNEHAEAFFHGYNFTKLLRKKQELFVPIWILFSQDIANCQKSWYTFVKYLQRSFAVTIEVELSGREFRRFTIFDLLRRRKQWHGPVLFALILGLSAALCFTKSGTRGAVLLGNVLLAVGLEIGRAHV